MLSLLAVYDAFVTSTILHDVYKMHVLLSASVFLDLCPFITLVLAPTTNESPRCPICNTRKPMSRNPRASLTRYPMSHTDCVIVQQLLLRLRMGVSNLYVWEYHVCLGNVIVSTLDCRQADLRVLAAGLSKHYKISQRR